MTDARFGYVTRENLALFTDLYEMTMLQGFYRADHNPDAVFDLFVRNLPRDRGYLVAAGLEQVVHYLDNLTFTDDAITYLQEQGFEDDFLAYLQEFSFSGDVRAVPEGTVVFADEPLIEVEAPLVEAQLLETMLINQVTFQTGVATKAARMRDVGRRHGGGQSLVDFGSRRAHGTDAGMKAARGSYIGGFAGTSNVAAGDAFDIPVFGTMAHSWIQSFDTEREAFAAYVDAYGEESILLIDTYDTMTGARTAKQVAAEKDVDIRGVRIDSGDLAALSQEVHAETGMDVFVSSGLDEYAIRQFFQNGGTATGFGVGTNLVTVNDAPAMEGVYKLVAVEHDGGLRPEMKLSEGKRTLPGRKSLRRVTEGKMHDIIGRRDEDLPGEEVLVDVFRDGELVYDLPRLDTVQERAQEQVQLLPGPVREIRDPDTYPVQVSEELEKTTAEIRAEMAR